MFVDNFSWFTLIIPIVVIIAIIVTIIRLALNDKHEDGDKVTPLDLLKGDFINTDAAADMNGNGGMSAKNQPENMHK